MFCSTTRYRVFATLLLAGLLLVPARAALAEDHLPPIPVIGPRLSPPVIAHTSVVDPSVPNSAPKPPQVAEVNEVYNDQPYYQPGSGVISTAGEHGSGITLYPTETACVNFNARNWWASNARQDRSDIWTDSYGGWGAFAVDDGFYQAKNVVFSLERTIGPGAHSGTNNYSVKIASTEPFAAGFGSPKITVRPGSDITVTVKYMLWDYVQSENSGDRIVDWASLGFKPDAGQPGATYVNGYVHGHWSELTIAGKAGESGQIMVLLQGQSTESVNANVYFDDIEIQMNGKYFRNCMFE